MAESNASEEHNSKAARDARAERAASSFMAGPIEG
jgi:hypothetical protein